jgi:hypothetical protein
MLIVFGFLLLVWAGVFAFLWQWAMEHIDGWWGGLLPISWVILAPLIAVQFYIWFN